MEGKHDIVAPIFKTKNSVVNKEEFIPRLAAKLQADNIELTIFKGVGYLDLLGKKERVDELAKWCIDQVEQGGLDNYEFK